MENDYVSSTPGAFRLRWDVFLSFRGEDTRRAFTNSLYESLKKHGIRAFLDDEGLGRGDEIAPKLLESIEDSAAYIVILSPKYADSRWCLDELAKICECRRLILPVFYLVGPLDVRQQTGPFGKDFAAHTDAARNHKDKSGEEAKVAKWRRAMAKVGGITGNGNVFKNSTEKEDLIRLLVNKVLTELRNTPMGLATYTVGLDSRVQEVMKLLDVKSNGIRVLGFHGKGGVGKTTLAKVLFNRLAGNFKFRSFISNVREISAQDDGLISLQNQLIKDLSRGKVLPVNEVSAGVTAIKKTVDEKQVLIVLDDVDNVSQLNALVGNKEWFFEGSRIIITTRDTQVLQEHLVNVFYEVRELDSAEALQLFSYHAHANALTSEKPANTFLKLSEQIVSLTGGLPLALEVFGCFLFDKTRVDEWEDALEKLKQIRPKDLQDVLKISFDGLDEEEKCIFLDMACLFVQMRMKREDAIDILKGCGFNAEIAVTVLTTRSLIKFIGLDDMLWMHDQVRDMGRQIVRDESLVDPGIRSRLWKRDEIRTVLENNKGTRCIQGIVLDFDKRNSVKDPSGDTISWNNFRSTPNFTTAGTYLKERYKSHPENREEKKREIINSKPLEAMVNLRLLQINNVDLKGKFKFLPAELKWLQWKGCPLKTLPSDFCPQELAVLDLSESKIERVCSYGNKVVENLKVLNLHGCFNLAAVPDLSTNTALEKLDLERCGRLSKIHESIGNMSKLIHLSLRDCSNLTELPSDVSGLKELKNLILSGCSKLEKLPENIGSMRSLKELLVDETAITILPESIFRLTKLEKLSLNGCKLLKGLPKYIGKLSSLKELFLDHSALEDIPDSVGNLANLEKLSMMCCESLTAFPGSIGNLKLLMEFFINGSAIKELPVSIGSLSNLKRFSVGHNHGFSKLPDSIGGLASILELKIDGTSITDLPDQIGALKILEKLEMKCCRSLTSLPESIGSILTLTTLIIVEANITELPESIGMLENLIMLRLDECEQLCRLPDSIGELKSLKHLLMEKTAVTELPESFGKLSTLMELKMAKKPNVDLPENTKPLDNVVLPTSFSKLSLLSEFDARAWKISGTISDDFEKLSSLEILNLGQNHFFSLPSSLRGMSILKKLLLPDCKELKSLPPLPSSLQELNVADCTALESMSDLSNMESLLELNLTNCEKVVDIPGLEFWKSLRRLYMGGCNACSSVVKRRLTKVSLRNLHRLSMPGSKIPDWFSQEEVRLAQRKNREIKAVIIGVVVSPNQQILDDSRNCLPAMVDIQAEMRKLDFWIHKTTLHLFGVPKTNEDQIHLCRFPNYSPLVTMLKDGYKIHVIKKNPPRVEGVEVKKWGIHLVFDGDDDQGDEESVNESQQSISERLATFFSTYENDNCISESGCEVEITGARD